jgi:hypothetical protein
VVALYCIFLCALILGTFPWPERKIKPMPRHHPSSAWLDEA